MGSMNEIKAMVEGSVFYRNRYAVDVNLKRIASSLMFYVDDSVRDKPDLSMTDVLSRGVPDFQRDNDKWDQDRQINFIENMVCGYRPVIQLYTTEAHHESTGGLGRCWILDGLQRLTAITRFLSGDLILFDGRANYQDLLYARLLFNVSIRLEVFTFVDDVEAAQFYIQLNRGITHSKEDIDRAEQFIKSITILRPVVTPPRREQ